MVWDDENRLKGDRTLYLAQIHTNTLTYNADGLLVRRDAHMPLGGGNTTTKQIWDRQNVLVETDGSNATQMIYTSQPEAYGRLISQRRSSTNRYYHFDALGSTDRLTDSSEAVTDSYGYRAYGLFVGSSGSTVTPFKWIGELGYYQYETIDINNLPFLFRHYVRARHYDPLHMVWVSADPIEYGNGANLYNYVDNSPILRIDPNGMDWLDCMAKCIDENDFPWEAIAATCLVGMRTPKEIVYPGQASTESVLVKCCVRGGAGKGVIVARWVSRAAIIAVLIEGAWDWVAIAKCSIKCS